MADGLNKVMLLGRLGADPELRFTQGGQAVLNIRLATTESYLDKDKVRRERTDWHTVIVWGRRGEALAKILNKGSLIFIEGSLRTSTYEKDGQKRTKTEIVASNVLLTGGRGNGGEGGDGADAPQGEDQGHGSAGRRGSSGGGQSHGSRGGHAGPHGRGGGAPAQAPADDYVGDYGGGGSGGGGGPDDDVPFASCSPEHDPVMRRLFG